MNSKITTQSSASNVIKWTIAIVLTCIGFVANYYYRDVAWSLRLVGWILLAIAVFSIIVQTTRGQQFLSFAKDSRSELRKVDWPKRQETIQFTIGVVIMVIIMSLALWLIDTVLFWVVKWFTG